MKNLILTVIAVALAKTFRINEIASQLPVSVKTQKTKQKRLLRFIDSAFPIHAVMRCWLAFVLSCICRNHNQHTLILIDETDLVGEFKAIVAALPFRHRAIPIYWHIYKDSEIQSLKYKSHNQIIQRFCITVCRQATATLPKRCEPMLIFDRGFARAKYVIKFLKVHRIPFLMRVCRNVGFEVNGVVKMLKQMDSTGFYPQILYHSTEQIRLHLYVVIDNRFDDSMYLISNRLIGLQIYSCYKRRMQIEHGFRDIKSCFGFGSLVLKRPTKSRINLLWLLATLTYGLLFITYEKAGYRWAKAFNTKIKTYSLITVIKRVVSQAWVGFCLSPFFSLPICTGDIVSVSYSQCFSPI